MAKPWFDGAEGGGHQVVVAVTRWSPRHGEWQRAELLGILGARPVSLKLRPSDGCKHLSPCGVNLDHDVTPMTKNTHSFGR